MGTILGAYISKAGYDIDLISRNKNHIKALKEKGAHVIGKTDFIQSVSALLPEEMTEKYDIFLLMTKQMNNKEIVKSLIPYMTDKAVICTMQNGLPELSISEVIGKDKTLGCTMSWGATFIGNGVAELTSEATRESMTFSIGKFGNNDEQIFQYIIELLNSMGEVKIEQNFIGARWAKLLINADFSGLSVITSANFGEIAKNKTSRLMALTIIKECIDVAKKSNIRIEPLQEKDIVKLMDYKTKWKKWISYHILPLAMRKHKLIKSSMLRDLERGRKCEIEAINGVVCKYGDMAQIETPINDKIVEIVHKIEKKELHSEWKNLNFLKEFI